VGMIVGMTVAASRWAAKFVEAMQQPGHEHLHAMEDSSIFALAALFGSIWLAAALGYFCVPFLNAWLQALAVLTCGAFFHYLASMTDLECF